MEDNELELVRFGGTRSTFCALLRHESSRVSSHRNA